MGKIPLGGFNVLQPGVAWQPSETQPLLPALPSVFKLHGQQVHLSINFQPHFANHLGSEFSILLNLDELGKFWANQRFFPQSSQSHQSTKDIDCLPTPIFTFLHPDISDDRELELEIILRWLPISKPTFPVTSVLVHQPK